MQNEDIHPSPPQAKPLVYGSVCSGIESATVAWHPLGWRPAFFSEIDNFPRAVLAHHYRDTPCHGDFTTIQANTYQSIDLLVGGTPCFPAGTMIATTRGFVPIEKVMSGDYALTHTGRFCQVLRTGSKIASTIRVKGQGHHGLVTTTNHPFLARQKSGYSTRVKGKPIRVSTVSDPAWIPAEHLKGKHWACVADWPPMECPPLQTFGREHFAPQLSEDLFRLAGLSRRWVGED